MAAGYWVGDLISEWQGGEPLWIVGGMMTGFILGIASIYLIIRNYMRGGPNG
ncbi:hypothetical protein KNP414_00046 [Paenibacillus mucilaginosus KNP414]|nr:hypothetical protein KNP414_00046 [Paenibacillus mucilaginosus KNP414]